MKQLLILISLMVVLLSCSTMSSVGYISQGDKMLNEIDSQYGFIVVKSRDLFSPCTTTVFRYDRATRELTKVDGGTGASALGTLAGPAATAYAGHEIGQGIDGSGDTNNINNSSSSKSRSRSRSWQIQGQQ